MYSKKISVLEQQQKTNKSTYKMQRKGMTCIVHGDKSTTQGHHQTKVPSQCKKTDI